jgi:hypothetical protein
MAKIVIRFNTKHVGDSDVWRIFEDDREHHVSEFRIEEGCVESNTSFERGEQKWNVCCEGELIIRDGKALIYG